MSDWRPVDLSAWPRESMVIHPIGHLIGLITVMGAVIDEFAERSDACCRAAARIRSQQPHRRNVPASSPTGSTAPRSTSFRTRSRKPASPRGRRRRQQAPAYRSALPARQL